MSSLTDADQRYFVKLFDMGTGYVLDYTDATFADLFRRHGILIHDAKYQTYGTSKAKKLRSFWEQEADAVIAPILSEMLDTYEARCKLNGLDIEQDVLKAARTILDRLYGRRTSVKNAQNDDDFLRQEFSFPNIQKLPVEDRAKTIIEKRLTEALTTLSAGAHLSTILLCGSVLEAVLLGAGLADPDRFHRAPSSPKDRDQRPKPIQDWKLAQLIDVASEIGILDADVKKFSHALRDFRNYIHPYGQMASGFSPDEHTAKVCFHVLKAALASVAGERR